jgi:hypothetical protein
MHPLRWTSRWSEFICAGKKKGSWKPMRPLRWTSRWRKSCVQCGGHNDSKSVAVQCSSCVDACSVAVHGISFSMSSLKSAIASRTPTSPREKLTTIVEFMPWPVAFPAQLRPRVACVTPIDVASRACAICWIVATSAATCKIVLAQLCHAMEHPGCAQASACAPVSHRGQKYACDWTRRCPVLK